jgi:hypothetical protein
VTVVTQYKIGSSCVAPRPVRATAAPSSQHPLFFCIDLRLELWRGTSIAESYALLLVGRWRLVNIRALT